MTNPFWGYAMFLAQIAMGNLRLKHCMLLSLQILNGTRISRVWRVFAGQRLSICVIQKLDVASFERLAAKNCLIYKKIRVDPFYPCSSASHFLVLQTSSSRVLVVTFYGVLLIDETNH